MANIRVQSAPFPQCSRVTFKMTKLRRISCAYHKLKHEAPLSPSWADLASALQVPHRDTHTADTGLLIAGAYQLGSAERVPQLQHTHERQLGVSAWQLQNVYVGVHEVCQLLLKHQTNNSQVKFITHPTSVVTWRNSLHYVPPSLYV